jgi:hypothetical protein
MNVKIRAIMTIIERVIWKTNQYQLLMLLILFFLEEEITTVPVLASICMLNTHSCITPSSSLNSYNGVIS